MDCLFCKLDKGEIPTEKLYEDDKIFVIKDIHPKADVHLLIIPHLHIESLLDVNEAHENLLGYMISSLKNFAKTQGISGFKTLINTGKTGGQEIFHLHIHLLGGKKIPKIA
ncbi:MAG TPA: HIT domain-containing protein [Gammaproteobacteria bacterium]|nr:HIT domain-containing protein [Gammaproteobacteria bacterium]